MAFRIFQTNQFTPTGTGDAASALANATYMAIKGGSGTQRSNIAEIYVNGMAASTSSPMALQFARHSTIATTPTALAAPASDGPVDPATAALGAPVITFTAAGTGPQRSAATTDARLNMGINGYGGAFRWQAGPGQSFVMLGASAQFGEASLSAYTGGTASPVNAHIMYETLAIVGMAVGAALVEAACLLENVSTLIA